MYAAATGEERGGKREGGYGVIGVGRLRVDREAGVRIRAVRGGGFKVGRQAGVRMAVGSGSFEVGREVGARIWAVGGGSFKVGRKAGGEDTDRPWWQF